MSQVAVNKDGTEVIGEYLIRGTNSWIYPVEKLSYKDWFDFSAGTEWTEEDLSIKLPKGSIKKLTGKDITWDNEPIELV